MRVVCISDIHNHKLQNIPDGDILIVSGDILGHGSIVELQKMNTILSSLNHKYKLYTPGNHDRIFEYNQLLAKETLSSCKVLIDEYIEIEGIKMYFTPWTPTFGRWSFMADELQLKNIFSNIPNNLDVLVSHGPPHGILDKVPRGMGLDAYHRPVQKFLNVGSTSLIEEVKIKNPKYHVFGHIHEGYGIEKHIFQDKETTFINCSLCDENYLNLNKPIIIDF